MRHLALGLLAGMLFAACARGEERQAATRADVIRHTEEYRLRLEELLPLYEGQARSAEQTAARREELHEKGLLARHELDQANLARDQARRQVEETRLRIREAHSVIAEILLAEELEEKRRTPAQEAVIFHTGKTPWSFALLPEIELFYTARWDAPLPISAMGQTSLHTLLGFVHKDAFDVALHPDSPEGEQLMEYLRKAGISFIAFRQALPGSATGAHIHIGKPSVRLPAMTSESAADTTSSR